jgi:hypothetical protein
MIVFQSDASGDVMMFDNVAQHMMEIMGKEKGARGVISVEQLPACIARLKTAIAGDKARARAQDDAGAEESGGSTPVGLAQRALPLLELLQRSLAREKPVLWGV